MRNSQLDLVLPRRSTFRYKSTALLLAASIGSLSALEPPVHVLMLSLDGIHALDVARYVAANPSSSLAYLVSHGVNYTTASSARPADSFPGMLALATGGSPSSTGVYFDLSYDRSLWPPGITSGPTGAVVEFNENVTLDSTRLDGGGGLNPAKLPRDPRRGGAVVYPHDYLRVNTIFEVVKAAGYRTAWSDKHLTDEIVQGPSGNGVDDLFVLEIAGNNAFGTSITKSLDATKAFDDIKVQGILNQINGLDHTGVSTVGVPALFGMNFQAISVGQRLQTNKTIKGKTPTGAAAGPGGYLDGTGTPSFLLLDALNHTDASLGMIIDALRSKSLLDSTYIILTAKHGQAPIDPTKLKIVSNTAIPSLIDPSVVKVSLTSGDDAALLWLADQTQTTAAVSVLQQNQPVVSIQEIWSGERLKLHFPDPLQDPRTPDIIAIGIPGTIYAAKASKIAEHGGFSDDDNNVPIIISHPKLGPQTITSAVRTAQVAPTILQLLGLSPFSLQAVVKEKTTVLPGFESIQVAQPAFLATGVPSSTIQLSDGQTRFTLSGATLQSFTIQASSDLLMWTSIGTNSLLVSGSTSVEDPHAVNFTNRFYRALITP